MNSLQRLKVFPADGSSHPYNALRHVATHDFGEDSCEGEVVATMTDSPNIGDWSALFVSAPEMRATVELVLGLAEKVRPSRPREVRDALHNIKALCSTAMRRYRSVADVNAAILGRPPAVRKPDETVPEASLSEDEAAILATLRAKDALRAFGLDKGTPTKEELLAAILAIGRAWMLLGGPGAAGSFGGVLMAAWERLRAETGERAEKEEPR